MNHSWKEIRSQLAGVTAHECATCGAFMDRQADQDGRSVSYDLPDGATETDCPDAEEENADGPALGGDMAPRVPTPPFDWRAVEIFPDNYDVVDVKDNGYHIATDITKLQALTIEAAPVALDILKRIMGDLPSRRDWLDPVLEQEARNLIALTESSALVAH